VMSPLLALVALGIALLGVRAVRKGARPGDLFPPLALALTTTFIAVNKVGSPQYIAWLAVPIVLGIATSAAGNGRSFRTPAILGLAIAGLTQVIYPYFYHWLISLDPIMISALTVRNILEFVLLGWAIVAVYQAPSAVALDDGDGEEWLPSVWPLSAPSEPMANATAAEPEKDDAATPHPEPAVR